MKSKVFCLLSLLFLSGFNVLHADEFDTLRAYWQNYLIINGGGVSSITSTANSDWSSMNTSPTRTYLWSDLPLGSVSANITGTFQRLQAMALAYATPGSSLQGNTSLAAAVAGGLDWMTANTYSTTATEYDNWFHWEDSGPMALGDAMLLLYPALTGTQITNYCASIDHFNPYSPYATFGWMTGANTSDKVLVMLLRGIAGRSTNSMVTAQTNLSPVFLYVNTGDGFYNDGSFVFHSNGSIDGVAYNGHYGLVLLGDIPEIVDLLQASTDWKITDPNLANVYAWVTNSFEPFLYNGTMMDTVRGRIVSWSYETESGDGSSTLSAMKQIGQFAPPAIGTAFTNFANSPRLAAGQFHFPSMGRVVALRGSSGSGFGFALSMESSRTADYESINSGNLHGWHQGDGMNYLYIGSTENQFNSDFWPTVDPYHLPGTTVETNTLGNSANQTKVNDQNWVGGAQVAKTYGVAGMSLHPLGTTVSGKKSWFMLDNEIVCLGAGITCGDAAGVDTTAENRRLGNPITQTFVLNGTNLTPAVGWSSNLPVATASWCALSGTGGYYIPAGNSNLVASFTANTGSWSAINSGDDSTSRTDDYFRLVYNHGTLPTNASYSYIILPNATTLTVSNYANAPDILILSNTPQVQAVKKVSLGVVAANFWTNGNNSADLISVNNKSSVITWENVTGLSVGVCDPTQTNTGSILVTLNRPAVGLLSADPGITVQQLSPQIIFSANVNGTAGKSLQATFSYTGPGIPIISLPYPNGTNLCQSTNTMSFNLAAGAGIATSNIIVTLNGVTVSNLTFTGASTNWNVGCPLAPNMVYTAVITTTDTNGNIATMTNSFDTFSFGNYVVQAEDFDYNGGHFFDNPQTNAYAGLTSITNVDTHQANFGGADTYRKNGMDTEVNGDLASPPFIGTGKTDYSIGYFSSGAWANYTRHYPAGSYYIYARLASGGGATTCTLSRVTAGWGTTSQTTNFLGTFAVPNNGWETYSYIPLLDNSGKLVTVTLTGPTNTLRLVRPGASASDCNANFLMLVPVFATSYTSSSTNVAISFPTQTGFNYQVLYKNNLSDPAWQPLGSPMTGNSAMQTFSDLPGSSARFYRVQIQ